MSQNDDLDTHSTSLNSAQVSGFSCVSLPKSCRPSSTPISAIQNKVHTKELQSYTVCSPWSSHYESQVEAMVPLIPKDQRHRCLLPWIHSLPEPQISLSSFPLPSSLPSPTPQFNMGIKDTQATVLDTPQKCTSKCLERHCYQNKLNSLFKKMYILGPTQESIWQEQRNLN